MSQGYQSSLGIDSANPVTKGFEFTACSVGKRGSIIDASGLRGSASHRSERTRAGNYSVLGTIEMQPSPEELALLLPWILGIAASGNVYALADALVSRYITVDKVAKVFTYAGCYVNKATFKGSEGQATSLSLDIVGQTETIGNAGTFPSVTFQDTPPFIHSEAVLALQSASRLVKDWTLTIDNTLETMFYNSVSASRITRKDRLITFECTNPFTSAEVDLYNQALAGAAASLALAQAGTNYSLTFAFATLQFPDQSPIINSRQEIPLHLSGVARMVGSTKELITTLVSASSRLTIAVGMALSGHPPHRSVRAELPHTALTLDGDEIDSYTVQSDARFPGTASGASKVCTVFSSVSLLSSADSAAVGSPALFARFSGTTRLSDFPKTCTSDVWHRAFSDRSVSEETDVFGISRLPRGKFPTVLVVFDSVGVTSDLPLTFDITIAFPLSVQGRPPQKDVFGARYTARLYLCERFASPVARRRASLEAEAIG